VVAGLLAILVEWRFIRDLMKNVVPDALEHSLPNELRGAALSLFQQDAICVDCFFQGRLIARPAGHLIGEFTSIRTFKNLSTKAIELPMRVEVDDCLPDAPGPTLLELSSNIDGVAGSVVHHFDGTGSGFDGSGRLRYAAAWGTRTLERDAQLRVVIRWREVRQLEDTLHQTYALATYRPKVLITVDDSLPLEVRAEMSSQVAPLRQGILFELPFTLLPYQPIVIRWRLKDQSPGD